MFVFFWMEVSMGLVGVEGCLKLMLNLLRSKAREEEFEARCIIKVL